MGNSDQPPPLDLLSPSSTDEKLLEGAHLSIKYGEPSVVQIALTNADRAFGARLAGEIARKHGAEGLRDETIVVEASGTAGQSFGAFADARHAPRPRRRRERLRRQGALGRRARGEAAARGPPSRPTRTSSSATRAFTARRAGRPSSPAAAGERFAVRNSGAHRRRRGRRRSRLRVHDGRHRRGPRADRPELRAGMSGGIAYVSTTTGPRRLAAARPRSTSSR